MNINEEIKSKVKRFNQITKATFQGQEQSLIEEVGEFNSASTKLSMIDAVCDVAFCCESIIQIIYSNVRKGIYGGVYHGLKNQMIHALITRDLNYEKNLLAVCDSNLSKFDNSFKDSLLTKEKYDLQGIPTYNVETMKGVWVTYCKQDITIGDKLYFKDKILKSHKYNEPVFILDDV